MNLDDLRLPCEHGLLAAHRNLLASCVGGRAPTRAELIEALGVDYDAAAQALYERERSKVENDYPVWRCAHAIHAAVAREWAETAVNAALGIEENNE